MPVRTRPPPPTLPPLPSQLPTRRRALPALSVVRTLRRFARSYPRATGQADVLREPAGWGPALMSYPAQPLFSQCRVLNLLTSAFLPNSNADQSKGGGGGGGGQWLALRLRPSPVPSFLLAPSSSWAVFLRRSCTQTALGRAQVGGGAARRMAPLAARTKCIAARRAFRSATRKQPSARKASLTRSGSEERPSRGL